MPKLSELITGGATSGTPRLRLSDVMAQSSDFSTASLPHAFGGLGISSEMGDAAGMGAWDRFAQGLPTAAADMFGSDEDLAASFLKRFPGSKIVKDREGFNAIELPNGKRFALDQPGVQGNEVATALGNIAAFTPAGRAAGAVRTGGLVGKAAVGGGASLLTDIALQKVAGRDDIDTQRAALAGLGGVAGEFVSPLLGKVSDKAVALARKLFSSDGDMVKAGREYARQLGISNPSDDVAKAIAARWKEIQAGASPGSILAESEMGLKLTQGQKTGDFGMLAREDMLRSSASQAGQAMRGVDDANREAITAYFNAQRNKMAGGAAAADTGDAFGRIGKAVGDEYAAVKDVVNRLYGRVEESRGVVSRKAVGELPRMLDDAVRKFNVDTELTPATARTLGRLQTKIAQLPEAVTGVTIKAIEGERQKLNNAIGAAANKTDKAALMSMKRAFDSWYDDLADSAIISGDSEVIDAMKAARSARATLSNRFEAAGKDDIGGKLVAKLVSGRASPEELAQAALGASQVSKASGAQFVNKLKAALKPNEGPMNPAWGQMKAAVLQKLVTGKGGESLGPQAIVSNLKEALRNRGTMMRTLYEPEELNALSRAAQTLDAIVPKGAFAKSSGTSERMFRYVEQLLSGVPFGSSLVKAIRAPGQAAAAANAYTPVRVPGLPDAFGVGFGAAGGSAINR